MNQSKRAVITHEDLTYEEKLVRILEWVKKLLRNKVVPLIKVLWQNHKIEEATWEHEGNLKKKHPELFKFSRTKIL